MGQRAVHKVLISVIRCGKSDIYPSDLIFIDSRPHLVLDWEEVGDEREPSVLVPLNAADLRPLAPIFGGGFVYQVPVRDPRRSRRGIG